MCYYNTIMLRLFFIVECGIMGFSVLCVCSKFGHHPHPLGYLCAIFVSFVTSISELAHGEKLHTQPITQVTHPAYLMPQEPKRFALQN